MMGLPEEQEERGQQDNRRREATCGRNPRNFPPTDARQGNLKLKMLPEENLLLQTASD